MYVYFKANPSQAIFRYDIQFIREMRVKPLGLST